MMFDAMFGFESLFLFLTHHINDVFGAGRLMLCFVQVDY